MSTNRDAGIRRGRVAVFRLNSGRVVANLATAPLYDYTENLPDFSHWGTEEIIITMAKAPEPKEVA
jgi:hypothetical protein